MTELQKHVEKRAKAEKIWTSAFLCALKKKSPKKATKSADKAVRAFDQRWGS